MVGKQDAETVAWCHLRALDAGALDTGESGGSFEEWRWWSGATRVVWLPLGGDVVFKIERMPYGVSNLEEHRKISEWRRQGFAWAPETWLLTVECAALTSPTILAMPYYPCAVPAADIPESALARVDDSLPANFARAFADGQVMLIDAG